MSECGDLIPVLFPPLQWPQFFADMLQSIQSGHLWSVDLYLRILMAIDSEVVDRHIVHTQEVCMHDHKLRYVLQMVTSIVYHSYVFLVETSLSIVVERVVNTSLCLWPLALSPGHTQLFMITFLKWVGDNIVHHIESGIIVLG